MVLINFIDANEVRRVVGTDAQRDISDDDLEAICEVACEYARAKVFRHIVDEQPNGNPKTGVGIDGSNTRFVVKNPPIADVSGDGNVSNEDISAYWIDENYYTQNANISVEDANRGIINITQDDGVTPIPATAKGVYVTYYHARSGLNYNLLKKAATYYAAHLLIKRLTESNKVTFADLQANRDKFLVDANRFLDEAHRLFNMVCVPKGRVVI